MGRRHRVPSGLGLRSLGKKVNSESLCAPRSQPKKKKKKKGERERERERKTQRPELWRNGIRSFIFKRGFYTLSYTFLEMKDAESAQYYISLTFIGTTMFSAYLFIYKGLCIMYIIFWPGGLLTFYDPFLIKVDQPENLFSLEVFFLYISNLCQP